MSPGYVRAQVLSVTITETEVAEIGSNYLEGHYVAHNYFMSTKDAPECDEGFDPLISRKFVEHYQQMFGAGAVVNDPMESAYIAVHMWGRAVQLAGTFEIPQVLPGTQRSAEWRQRVCAVNRICIQCKV